jgi:hypothetical protein
MRETFEPIGMDEETAAAIGDRDPETAWNALTDARWLLRSALRLALSVGGRPANDMRADVSALLDVEGATYEEWRRLHRRAALASVPNRLALLPRVMALRAAIEADEREAAAAAHLAVAYGAPVTADDVRAVVPWSRVEPLVDDGLAAIEARQESESAVEANGNGNGGGRG